MTEPRTGEDEASDSRLSGQTGRPETGRRTRREERDVERHVFAAAARGDRAAFAALLRHYDRLLRLVVFRLLDDRDEMDDVMQEVALKLYRTLPALRSEAALSTWLYRTAYSTCVDHLRKRRPTDPFAPDELPEPRRAGTDPNDPAEVVARASAIETLLAQLTPQQRLVVTLVDQEGFDYASVGAIAGVPVGTVASRLNAARAVLRKALEHDARGERDAQGEEHLD